jgi:glutaredoxin
MRLRLILLIVLAFAGVASAHATRLYKWIDRDGNVSYHDRPPPTDGYRVEEKRFGTGGSVYDSSRGAPERLPVVLYSAPKCSPCDAARAYLERRGVPFTEKNVQSDAAAQQELAKRAGELAVPTITVGDKVMRGFLESLLEGELDQAGYPRSGAGGQADDDDGEAAEPGDPEEAEAAARTS